MQKKIVVEMSQREYNKCRRVLNEMNLMDIGPSRGSGRPIRKFTSYSEYSRVANSLGLKTKISRDIFEHYTDKGYVIYVTVCDPLHPWHILCDGDYAGLDTIVEIRDSNMQLLPVNNKTIEFVNNYVCNFQSAMRRA